MRPRESHCFAVLSATVCFLVHLTATHANSIRTAVPSTAHSTVNTTIQPHWKERQVRSASTSLEEAEYEDFDDEDVGDSVEEGRGSGGKAGSTSDAFNGYYDFVINEGSFKFWSVFQIFTAALLIYSAFAAIYYAKYNYEPPEEDDYGADILFKRSGTLYSTTPKPYTSFLGLNKQTFQRIMDSIASKKYSS